MSNPVERTRDTHAAPSFDQLAADIRGAVITPDDPGYDQARAVYNGMIDRRPAAIAMCADEDDVIACVRFAAAAGLDLAVRGGGHHTAGLGVWDDALVIDLSGLRTITVDPTRRRWTSEAGAPGARWTGPPRRTGWPSRAGSSPRPVSVASPSVVESATSPAGWPDHRQPAGGGRGARRRHPGDGQLAGVPGPVLGDPGWGWQLRRDHVVPLRLPSHRRARHDHRRARPLRPQRHPGGDAVVPRAPPGPSRGVERLDRPHHHPARAAVPRGAMGTQGLRHRLVSQGPHDRADDVLSPIRQFGSPLVVGLGAMPFAALQSAFDALYPPGCSGTGERTSSARSPTRPSRCT